MCQSASLFMPVSICSFFIIQLQSYFSSLSRFSMNISNHLFFSCLLDQRDTCLIACWCNDMQMCFVASVDIAGIADVSCESEVPLWQVTRGTGPDEAMVSGHRCRPPWRPPGQTHRQWPVSPGPNPLGDIIIIIISSVISVNEEHGKMFSSQL